MASLKHNYNHHQRFPHPYKLVQRNILNFSSPPPAPSPSTPLVEPSLPALDLVVQSPLELLATLTRDPGSATCPRDPSHLAWPPRPSQTEPRLTHPWCHAAQSPQECHQAHQGSPQALQARASPGSTPPRRPSRRQGARARQAVRRGVWGLVDLLVLPVTQASCPGI